MNRAQLEEPPITNHLILEAEVDFLRKEIEKDEKDLAAAEKDYDFFIERMKVQDSALLKSQIAVQKDVLEKRKQRYQSRLTQLNAMLSEQQRRKSLKQARDEHSVAQAELDSINARLVELGHVSASLPGQILQATRDSYAAQNKLSSIQDKITHLENQRG